jgi:hypothetical protein
MNDPNTLKKIIFYPSLEAQENAALQASISMTPQERLSAMYELNRKIYGENYGKLTKVTKLFCALPGESLHDFFKRKNEE